MTVLLRRSTILLGVLLAFSSLSFASTLYIYPSIGPSVFSPNADAYLVNALNAIQAQSLINPSQSSTGGTAGTPSYYSQVGNTISPYDIVTTMYDGGPGFNAWEGVGNPAAPYSNEFGSAIFFGLYVFSPGTTFTMADVVFNGDFVPGETLAGVDFTTHTVGYVCTNPTATTYLDPTCTQVVHGANDDQQPLNFLFTSGFSAWFTVGQIEQYHDAYSLLFGASGSQAYNLGSDTASVFITVVPEPATLGLFGLGFVTAFCFRRKVSALLGR